MGMFDDVNVEIPCSKCGGVTIAQTKDFLCALKLIDPEYVKSFKCYCQSCRNIDTYERDWKPIYRRGEPFTLEEVEQLGFKLSE